LRSPTSDSTDRRHSLTNEKCWTYRFLGPLSQYVVLTQTGMNKWRTTVCEFLRIGRSNAAFRTKTKVDGSMQRGKLYSVSTPRFTCINRWRLAPLHPHHPTHLVCLFYISPMDRFGYACSASVTHLLPNGTSMLHVSRCWTWFFILHVRNKKYSKGIMLPSDVSVPVCRLRKIVITRINDYTN